MALTLVCLGSLTAAATAGTPISLLVPQENAIGVLGHSCSGIQQVYVTGFDGTTGYPIGAAFLSTRCGSGSGKGGGYHTTTYSAWVGTTWDFTGALISLSVLKTTPTVDAAFSATDGNGNQIYNKSSQAYLLLGPTYVPAPRLTGISTGIGPATGGTSVTISGTGFTTATGVLFGATAAAFIVNSDTSITATAPASTAGTVDITVTSAGGTTATTSSDQFTFIDRPVVTGISPTSGAINGGTTVTVTGFHLSGASMVNFGQAGTYFSTNDDTSITATSPAGETLEAVDITVTTFGGTSATSTADQFTYTPGVVATLPTVTRVAPNSGAPTGGNVVTIIGTHFTGTTAVQFGSTPAMPFKVISDTSITATAPAGSGSVNITVTNGSSPSAINPSDVYTYLPPVITKLYPVKGRAKGGTRVTIKGKYLLGVMAVTFDGVPASKVFVNRTGTVLKAVTPSEVGTGTRSVDVTVVTNSGATTLPAGFTYKR